MTTPPNPPQKSPPGPARADEQKPAVKEPVQPLPKQAQQAAQGDGAKGEYGEGNYKATRDYNDGVKRHLETHDIEKEARDAAPHSREEAQDMERAEEAGRAPGRDDVESVKGDKDA